MITEQIALAVIFYFGILFVFCMLEWFLIIMCKEHTLKRSANFLLETIINYVFDDGENVDRYAVLINFMIINTRPES